jgi:hypothetical protein
MRCLADMTKYFVIVEDTNKVREAFRALQHVGKSWFYRYEYVRGVLG